MVQDLSRSMVVGYYSCYVYALLFGLLNPSFGIAKSAVIAWVASFTGISVPMYFAMR